MARTWSGLSTEKISFTGVTTSAGDPIALGAWFKNPNTTSDRDIVGVRNGDSGSGNWTVLRMAGDGTIQFVHDYFGNNSSFVNSAAVYDDDAWHFALGVYDGTDLHIYVDQTLATTSAVGSRLVSLTSWVIGQRSDIALERWNGELAEVAIWKTLVPNAAQASAMANGFSPAFFPQGLERHFPIIGRYDPEIETRNSANGTIGGSLTVHSHPRIILPISKRIFPLQISTSIETASASPLSLTANLPTLTPTYIQVGSASVSPLSTTITLISVTATHIQIETASVAPLVTAATLSIVTATYIQVESVSVAPLETIITIPEVTANYTQVGTVSVSPLALTATLTTINATYIQIETASISPLVSQISIPNVTAGYAEGGTASVSPLDLTATFTTTTATYIQINSASISPLVASLTIPTITANYIQVETASVSPLVLSTALPEVTANSPAESVPDFTDDFNRADSGGAGLGSNWTDKVDGCEIASNRADGTATPCEAYYNGGNHSDADCYSQCVVGIADGGAASGVYVRWDTTGNNGYLALAQNNTSRVILYRLVSGAFTVLAIYNSVISDGDTLRLEVSGTGATVDLDTLVNGVSVGTYADTHANRITTVGKGGIRLNATGFLDDFEMGPLTSSSLTVVVSPLVLTATLPAVTATYETVFIASLSPLALEVSTPIISPDIELYPSFTDDFNRANSSGLGSSWNSSGWNIDTNRAVAQTTQSYAFYTTLPSSKNYYVSGVLNRTNSVDAVGFVLRALSVIPGNSYVAYFRFNNDDVIITRDGTTIYDSGSVGITPGDTGKVKIETIGSVVRISFYINGNLVASYDDSHVDRIDRSGYVGIYGGSGATIDDFSLGNLDGATLGIVEPLTLSTSIPSISAIYDAELSASVVPLSLALAPTSTTATYIQVETASVSPLPLNLTFPSITAVESLVELTRRRYIDDPLYAIAIGNRLPMNIATGAVSSLQTANVRTGDVIILNDSGTIKLCAFNGSVWKSVSLS